MLIIFILLIENFVKVLDAVVSKFVVIILPVQIHEHIVSKWRIVFFSNCLIFLFLTYGTPIIDDARSMSLMDVSK